MASRPPLLMLVILLVVFGTVMTWRWPMASKTTKTANYKLTTIKPTSVATIGNQVRFASVKQIPCTQNSNCSHFGAVCELGVSRAGNCTCQVGRLWNIDKSQCVQIPCDLSSNNKVCASNWSHSICGRFNRIENGTFLNGTSCYCQFGFDDKNNITCKKDSSVSIVKSTKTSNLTTVKPITTLKTTWPTWVTWPMASKATTSKSTNYQPTTIKPTSMATLGKQGHFASVKQITCNQTNSNCSPFGAVCDLGISRAGNCTCQVGRYWNVTKSQCVQASCNFSIEGDMFCASHWNKSLCGRNGTSCYCQFGFDDKNNITCKKEMDSLDKITSTTAKPWPSNASNLITLVTTVKPITTLKTTIKPTSVATVSNQGRFVSIKQIHCNQTNNNCSRFGAVCDKVGNCTCQVGRLWNIDKSQCEQIPCDLGSDNKVCISNWNHSFCDRDNVIENGTSRNRTLCYCQFGFDDKNNITCKKDYSYKIASTTTKPLPFMASSLTKSVIVFKPIATLKTTNYKPTTVEIIGNQKRFISSRHIPCNKTNNNCSRFNAVCDKVGKCICQVARLWDADKSKCVKISCKLSNEGDKFCAAHWDKSRCGRFNLIENGTSRNGTSCYCKFGFNDKQNITCKIDAGNKKTSGKTSKFKFGKTETIIILIVILSLALIGVFCKVYYDKKLEA